MSTSRREFVRGCAAAGVALAGISMTGCASVVVTRVTPVNGRARIRLVDHPALAERGGALRLLPDGAPDEMLVIRQDDGTFVVLSAVCTHNGCTVDPQPSRIVCPCHGSTYDRTGRVVVGPAERPLARFASRVTADGVLDIELGGAS